MMTAAAVEIVRRRAGERNGRVTNGPFLEAARSDSSGSWWEFALCRAWDADLFCVPDGVSPRRKRHQESKAKEICRACPVRERCLDEALGRDEQYGVWGGLDTAERRELERRRRGLRS